MLRFIFVMALLSCFACKERPSEGNTQLEKETASTTKYQESYRPQFHFSPPTQWMNDPNGLVYHNGVYHLFYQYYPEDTVWGPMHWGHATSENLIHWEHKPIALFPDQHGYIFSGSAVVDANNTSGLGTADNPPLVAIFTYHLMEGEQSGRDDFQTQGIAYSLDNGESWKKYEGNPVIGNSGIKDFRDPKVFWHTESNQWILILVAGDHAKFYGSPNLKSWSLLSAFGKEQGAHSGVWECPDLFKMNVRGTDEEKWVLLVSINPGAPNGGSGTQYFVGSFDGTTFTSEQEEIKWIDYGRDNYAGITYNNTPKEERLFIGWMSNWDYAQKTPTKTWRSAMTLPRNMSLHQDADGSFLKSYPVESLRSIAKEIAASEIIELKDPFEFKHENLQKIDLSFEATLSDALKIEFLNDANEKVTFEIDPMKGELLFDRSQSGITNFEERFVGAVQTQNYIPSKDLVEVRLIMDASSIEIFLDKGRYVFTNQIFPTSPYTTLKMLGQNGSVLKNYSLKQLNSIW